MMRFLTLFLAFVLPARAVDVWFSFEDPAGVLQTNRPVYIYPTPEQVTNGTRLVTRDRISTNSAGGNVVVSNLLAGGFRSELSGKWGTTTNWYNFPNTNGLVYASSYVTVSTNLAGGLRAYSQQSVDGKLTTLSNALIAEINNISGPTNGVTATTATNIANVAATNVTSALALTNPAVYFGAAGKETNRVPYWTENTSDVNFRQKLVDGTGTNVLFTLRTHDHPNYALYLGGNAGGWDAVATTVKSSTLGGNADPRITFLFDDLWQTTWRLRETNFSLVLRDVNGGTFDPTEYDLFRHDYGTNLFIGNYSWGTTIRGTNLTLAVPAAVFTNTVMLSNSLTIGTPGDALTWTFDDDAFQWRFLSSGTYGIDFGKSSVAATNFFGTGSGLTNIPKSAITNFVVTTNDADATFHAWVNGQGGGGGITLAQLQSATNISATWTNPLATQGYVTTAKADATNGLVAANLWATPAQLQSATNIAAGWLHVSNTWIGTFTGNGAGVTNLNATELKSGTMPADRFLTGGATGKMPRLTGDASVWEWVDYVSKTDATNAAKGVMAWTNPVTQTQFAAALTNQETRGLQLSNSVQLFANGGSKSIELDNVDGVISAGSFTGTSPGAFNGDGSALTGIQGDNVDNVYSTGLSATTNSGQVTVSANATNILNRSYWPTNMNVVAGETPDAGLGGYQWYITNASFNISGFLNLSNALASSLSLIVSNSGASAIVVSNAYAGNFAIGFTNSVSIPSGREAVISYLIRKGLRTNAAFGTPY